MHAMVEKFMAAETLDTCWRHLTEEMRGYGFDRMIYAKKPNGSKGNFHNQSDTIILSTYGSEVDAYFVENRGYIFDVTTNLALKNAGAISWAVSAARFASGQMTDQESAVHLKTRALGLIAGYTFSTRNTAGTSVSGFGLCYQSGFDQDHVDAIWVANQETIVAHLQLFELCVRRLPHIPEDQQLSERQRDILKWVAEGKTISQIAEILKIAERTVEKHMKEARDRFAVGTTLEAVLSATNQGQI